MTSYRATVGHGRFHIQSLTNRNGKPNPHLMAGQPYPTASFEDIVALAQSPVICAKEDAYWMLASADNCSDARTFSYQEKAGAFAFFLVDVDNGNKSLAEIAAAIRTILPGTKVLINSTSSAKADDQRWHLTTPLSATLGYSEFSAYQQALFNNLNLKTITVDRTLARPAQLFFLPSKVSTDAFYQYQLIDGEYYDPEKGVLYDAACHIFHTEVLMKRKLEATTSRGIGTHGSIISWFKANYLTEDLMTQYGYDFDGKEWSSPHQQQGSGGYSTMVRNDGSWFSFSESDNIAGIGRPAKGGRAGDAFDLLKHYAFCGNQSEAIKWVCCARMKLDPISPQLKQMVEAKLKEQGQ